MQNSICLCPHVFEAAFEKPSKRKDQQIQQTLQNKK
jgi:hypothetical protein